MTAAVKPRTLTRRARSGTRAFADLPTRRRTCQSHRRSAPWLIMVLSRATTGRPSRSAAATLGATTSVRGGPSPPPAMACRALTTAGKLMVCMGSAQAHRPLVDGETPTTTGRSLRVASLDCARPVLRPVPCRGMGRWSGSEGTTELHVRRGSACLTYLLESLPPGPQM